MLSAVMLSLVTDSVIRADCQYAEYLIMKVSKCYVRLF
jgi:hypothetical protein